MAYLTYRIPQILTRIQGKTNNNLYIKNGGTQRRRRRKSKTKKVKRKIQKTKYHSFNKMKNKTKKNKK